MKAFEIMYYSKVNDTDPNRVHAIAESIRANGWQGAPILVMESFGMLITGSHRLAALEELEDDLFDTNELGDVAEPVDDIINAWCEENSCSIDDIRFDSLSEIFANTWVEQYKDEIVEW